MRVDDEHPATILPNATRSLRKKYTYQTHHSILLNNLFRNAVKRASTKRKFYKKLTDSEADNLTIVKSHTKC